MANEEQLSILKQGFSAWHDWKREHPEAKIDLSRAVLRNADLRRFDLSNVDFFKANLSESNLEGANLNQAYLRDANLNKANLESTNLRRAELHGSDLSYAKLDQTDLSEANLNQADLRGAKIHNAMLNNTMLGSLFGGTTFSQVDLSKTYKLEIGHHYSPSIIAMESIQLSKGEISEIFLRGCGLSNLDIEYAKLYKPELSNGAIDEILYKMHDLRVNQAIQVSPLFISYNHIDILFVERLEHYLTRIGVRFWRDVHDMKSGRMEKQIDHAIRHNPTVLLVLSEHSLMSDWVEHEVRTARQLEREIGRDVLCPVALDDSWKNSSWPKRIMEQVMEYNILDFSAWKDRANFESTFNKLIDGLELFYK